MSPPTPNPDDTDMVMCAGDSTLSANPPAKLAARFYRKSSARQKSSANSSRRSSLSSIHSHHSTLSCHGGPRSSHIAQHLRRASIIESRKARLADKAAHAEQVRLRAAAAKANIRTSDSEKKVLAAQAAREKLLAEIAARCEEEVRRAKKVAEETKEKRAAEHARMREEFAEKFADAAKRRSRYLHSARKPRTASLAAVEEKKVNPVTLRVLDEAAAAKIIQRVWRRSKSRRVVTDFNELNLFASSSTDLSFEEATKWISEEHAIAVTSTLLKQLGLVEFDADDSCLRGAVRVFLSAFLILLHPMQALSHGGAEPQEQDLLTKARALQDGLEAYITKEIGPSSTRNSTTRVTKEDLVFLHHDFSASFHAWKSQDLGILLDVMVNSFVNLDLILQATKDDRDGHVAEDYLQAVKQEQIRLLAKIKRLAGSAEGLSRVKVAVRKARRQRAMKQRKEPKEQVPRASTPNANLGDSASHALPLTPPATPRPQQRQSQTGPSSLVSRLGQTMTVLPSNREIAHEMLITGTYEVQQQPWTDARKSFMETLRSNMRESMQRGGAQAAASWTHAMAVLIREKLLLLISQRHPLYNRVDDFLDLQLIDQQSQNGVFSYASFFETIGSLIAQLCSPGRDTIVKAFSTDTEKDIIDRLFVLINILDLMTLDHINFQFRAATRSVVEHGHEHEHALFERDLQEGTHTLQRTQLWWESARSTWSAQSISTGNAIYARGLVDLVLVNSHLNSTTIPETLYLDYNRLLNMRARAFQIAASSSILLTTKIRLRRNREALWSQDAERLMSLDFLTTTPARIVSLIESSHMMPESIKEGLLNFVSRVLPPCVAAGRNAINAEHDRLAANQRHVRYDPATTASDRIDSGDAFGEQIATFVLKSLREHIFARLSATTTAEKVRATSNAAEALSRAGMPEFVAEVNSMVETLERIRSVDLLAHGTWYDTVVQQSPSS